MARLSNSQTADPGHGRRVVLCGPCTYVCSLCRSRALIIASGSLFVRKRQDHEDQIDPDHCVNDEFSLLPAVCCLLPAACCLLSPACCLLPAVCCLLSAACCLLPAACCLLPAACCLLPAACCLLPAACCLLPATRAMVHDVDEWFCVDRVPTSVACAGQEPWKTRTRQAGTKFY